MMTETDFSDTVHWQELAKNLRYDLPRWKQPCTVSDRANFMLTKRAEDLTEQERFFIALLAGAEIETSFDNGKMVMHTKHPVGIVDRGDGGYIVGIALGPRTIQKDG